MLVPSAEREYILHPSTADNELEQHSLATRDFQASLGHQEVSSLYSSDTALQQRGTSSIY